MVPGAPSDNTDLQSVLATFAAEGFVDNYEVDDEGGVVHCPSGTKLTPDDLEVALVRRLEGASDPDDMMLVAGVRRAGAPDADTNDGVVVVKYGPDASVGEAELLVAWQSKLGDAERG